MRRILPIFLFVFFLAFSAKAQNDSIEFYDAQISFPSQLTRPDFNGDISQASFGAFVETLDRTDYSQVIKSLLDYKTKYKPDDWVYYQLIRKTAQYFSPKAANYVRYTLYKWYFLTRSGYDAILRVSQSKVLFYVQSNDPIYNIPYIEKNGKQYICLNYHDYGSVDFTKEKFEDVSLSEPATLNTFSYKVTHLPEFNDQTYRDKDLQFSYNETEYRFTIKINEEVKTIFKNYPVVDYAFQFNMPLNSKTYNSLIPLLRKQIKGLKPEAGVDFLMSLTRYAFQFKADSEIFGQEKRLSPEQTLLYEYSDCEDRAALFFFLVKELYDLPMIVLAYPKHVAIAIQFNKPIGKTINYNGKRYTLCEPTSQRIPLAVGQVLPEITRQSYEIVYAYHPAR